MRTTTPRTATTHQDDSGSEEAAEPVTQRPGRLTGRRHRLGRPQSLDVTTQNDGFDPSRLSPGLITVNEDGSDMYNDTVYNNTDPDWDPDTANLTATPEPTISQENWVNRQR